jgi:hypothetical protein
MEFVVFHSPALVERGGKGSAGSGKLLGRGMGGEADEGRSHEEEKI